MDAQTLLGRYFGYKPATYSRLFGMRRTPASTFGFDSLGAFLKAIVAAQTDPSLKTKDSRLQRYFAAPSTVSTEGIGADGGFAVPEPFEALLVDGVLADAPLLQVFQAVPMTTPSVQVPKFDEFDTDTFAGISGAWLDELAQYQEEKPRLTLSSMRAYKYGVLAPFSSEIIEDSPTTLDQVERGMVALVRRKWESAILSGDGVGKPLGILNSPSLVTESREASGTITWKDCTSLWARCAFRSTAVWVANFSSLPALLDLAQVIRDPTDDTPVHGIPRIREDADGNLTILRRPVVFTDAAPDLGQAGDLTLASPVGYISGLRRGITTQRSTDFYFASDALAVKITLRLGGQSIFSKPWTPREGATQSWAVALEANGT